MTRTFLVTLLAGASVLAVATASPPDAPAGAPVDAANGPRLVIIGGGSRPSEALARFAKETMESVRRLEVPLIVDTGMGGNWRDARGRSGCASGV